jgi:hypothetical protein
VKFRDPLPTNLGGLDLELKATRINDPPHPSNVHITTESQWEIEASHIQRLLKLLAQTILLLLTLFTHRHS